MAARLNLPSVVGLDLEGTSPGMVVFLQAVQDALVTVDRSVVYTDTVNINVPTSRLRATTAEGQGFSVSGVSVASADDYAGLVRDFKILLQDFTDLREFVVDLVDGLVGKTNA